MEINSSSRSFATNQTNSLYSSMNVLFYDFYRLSDTIERSSRFLFLRYAQLDTDCNSPNGFATGKAKNQAKSYANKIDRLATFANRVNKIAIENLGWKDVIGQCNGLNTVFYRSSPYVDQEAAYSVNGIDYDKLIDVIYEIDGDWLVSHEDIPDKLAEYEAIERERACVINSITSGLAKRVQERQIVSTD